jgi:hypothetical protein
MSPPLQGSRIIQARHQHKAGNKQKLTGFLLGLLFNPEMEVVFFSEM